MSIAETGVSRSATSRVHTTCGVPVVVGAREILEGGFDQHGSAPRRHWDWLRPRTPERAAWLICDVDLALALGDVGGEQIVDELVVELAT